MLRTMLVALTFAGAALSASASPTTDPTHGVWLTQSRKAKIEIAPCGASICGTVVWLADEKDGYIIRDARNQDPSKRTSRLLGSQMMFGFKPAKSGWTGGRIYNAEDGGTYRSEVAALANGTLSIKGCVGPICRTQIWTRP